jgi:nucleotidyltransferase substrate binding protein (TIGR01987 family)
MALDLAGLRRAIHSLESAIFVMQEKLAVSDSFGAEMDVIRAGVIQNFEFTYELCWKFMKRWLEENYGPVYVDGVPRRELFRLAAENLLLTDVDRWMDFHRARNRTSHVYDFMVAQAVLTEVLAFLPEAQDFLRRLEERNV